MSNFRRQGVISLISVVVAIISVSIAFMEHKRANRLAKNAEKPLIKYEANIEFSSTDPENRNQYWFKVE